jgi:hypothetical protein
MFSASIAVMLMFVAVHIGVVAASVAVAAIDVAALMVCELRRQFLALLQPF